jgi:Protein of unknown function (DUF3987)
MLSSRKGDSELSGGPNWSEPEWSIMDDRRGDLPDFPIDALSPPWRVWIVRAAHGAGVTPGHIAVPLLGVLGSLIGTARRVRATRSWSEPMTLWTCIVAPSGDRKTPALQVTLRALNLIEKTNSAAIEAARNIHETKAQTYKETIRQWKNDRHAALDANPAREPPPMPPDAIDPGDFVPERLFTTDPTIESLAPLLHVRPRGMMLIRDELSGLFFNMGRYSRGSDRAFWLEAWNGGPHVVERVSRSIIVDHLLIGVIGGFQPDKLARAFAGDEDGMHARFLFGWPTTPGYRPLTNEVSEVEPEFKNALSVLIRLPSEDAEGQFVPQYLALSEGAFQKFEKFRRFVDDSKRELDGRELQWYVKGESQVLRLAGVLASMAWAIRLGSAGEGIDGITSALEPTTVEDDCMASAILLWQEYFWPHARAALRQIGLTQRHANERRVLRWIKARQKSVVSVKDIRRDALGQGLDADQTQLVIESLVNSGWLRPRAVTHTGGRSRYRWEVHPSLFRLGDAESAESAQSND